MNRRELPENIGMDIATQDFYSIAPIGRSDAPAIFDAIEDHLGCRPNSIRVVATSDGLLDCYPVVAVYFCYEERPVFVPESVEGL